VPLASAIPDLEVWFFGESVSLINSATNFFGFPAGGPLPMAMTERDACNDGHSFVLASCRLTKPFPAFGELCSTDGGVRKETTGVDVDSGAWSSRRQHQPMELKPELPKKSVAGCGDSRHSK